MRKLIILCSVFVYLSCQNRSAEPIREFTPEKEYSPVSKNENIYYLLPSPHELIEIVHEEGIQYNDILLNPASLFHNYKTENAIQLNIGVYLADMAYCSLFDQHENIRKYMEVLNKMSRNIYLSESLKSELRGLSKSEYFLLDSLNQLSVKLFYDVTEDLESSNQQKAVSLICSGAYIESLYLSLNSVKNPYLDHNMSKRFAEQQFYFKNMLAYIKEHSGEFNSTDHIEKLEHIEQIYNSMEFSDEQNIRIESSDSNLIVKGGKVYKMDKNTYEALTEKVIALRTDFIQMN